MRGVPHEKRTNGAVAVTERACELAAERGRRCSLKWQRVGAVEQQDKSEEVEEQDTAGGWREHLTRGRRGRAGAWDDSTSKQLEGGRLRD